ncbi:MAG TPA: NAD(+)/NADH kinase [Terriglobales bacterium]
MPTVAIISKPQKPELIETIPSLFKWLRERRCEIVADEETLSYLREGRAVKREEMASYNPQFAIVLGGDGTLLAAARVFAQTCVPILGINLGSLGFLTEVPLARLYQNLQAALDGSCQIDSRTMLCCQLRRAGQLVSQHEALNDIVAAQGAIARMSEFKVSVDGMFVSNYKADGLIVATPTGSTAYSLAAGGPVVVPSVDALIITPISPHALTNRPLVVQGGVEVKVLAFLRQHEAFLTVDGQVGIPLQDGDEIICRRSDRCVNLMRINGNRFFEVLRNKLHWGER